VVGQDPAHDHAAEGEEVRSVLPGHAGAAGNPEVGLVREGGRLEGVAGPLLPEGRAGEGAEVGIHRVEHGLHVVGIAGGGLAEDAGDVVARFEHAGSYPGHRNATVLG
jgi:hypothetical protein